MTSTYTTNKNIEKPAYNDYATNATGWSGPVNTDWDIIDRSLGGTQVKNPTGVSGTVDLTVAECQPPILVIGTSISGTATLTANVTYRIPSGVGGVWSVYNNTSGSFAIIISNVGGGTSVQIPQGNRVSIYSDGTNIRLTDSIPAAAGSNGQVQYNSGGYLGASSNFTFDGSNVVLGGTLVIGAGATQNIAADTTTLYLRGSSFSFQNAAATVTKLFMDSSGNVIIGSGSPTQKLEVSGQIYSNTGGFRFPDNSVQTTAAQTVIPSGTSMLFFQSAAPTGWTQSGAVGDRVLRVVSGSGGGTGGSINFSSYFSGSYSVGGTALSVGQLPAHAHTLTDPGHNHSIIAGGDSTTGGLQGTGSGPVSLNYTNYATTGITVDNTGGNETHTHTIPSLQYADVIICTKN